MFARRLEGKMEVVYRAGQKGKVFLKKLSKYRIFESTSSWDSSQSEVNKEEEVLYNHKV